MLSDSTIRQSFISIYSVATRPCSRDLTMPERFNNVGTIDIVATFEKAIKSLGKGTSLKTTLVSDGRSPLIGSLTVVDPRMNALCGESRVTSNVSKPLPLR